MSDYVMVPKEPTEEMLDAGQEARKEHTDVYLCGDEVAHGDMVEHVYRAMIAAAPAAPSAAGVEEIAEVIKRNGPSRVLADNVALDRARAVLSLLSARGWKPDWQPIETAKKDGTLVDLWVRGRRFPECRWMEDAVRPAGWWAENGRYRFLDESVTHWLPLPPAPPAKEVKS